MKALFLGLLLTLTTMTASAALRGSPFIPEVDQRFSDVEVRATAIEDISVYTSSYGSYSGVHNMRILRAEYDVALQNGGIGQRFLGPVLPAKTIIVRSWLYIVTQFVDAGVGTVAITCETANNIKTATDITGSAGGALIEGESTGAASAFKSIAAPCGVQAVVAGAAQSAGKLIAYAMYVVAE